MFFFSVRTLERARSTGNFAESSEALENIKSDMSSCDQQSDDDENDSRRNKRMKA